jgi:hypothetical protein
MSKGSISKKEIPTPEKGIRKKRKKKKKKKKFEIRNGRLSAVIRPAFSSFFVTRSFVWYHFIHLPA